MGKKILITGITDVDWNRVFLPDLVFFPVGKDKRFNDYIYGEGEKLHNYILCATVRANSKHHFVVFPFSTFPKKVIKEGDFYTHHVQRLKALVKLHSVILVEKVGVGYRGSSKKVCEFIRIPDAADLLVLP